ncbi:hypothetical protein [Pseudomonas sp. TWP3-2]|uniref:hypothetical protein n=1 Tax=Pseudomonas sp. TWP3-2 TaxID=2804574 RepID=UPI003CF2307E
MTNPYIEHDAGEFSVNNCVHCGQTEYHAGFGEDPAQNDKIKSAVPKAQKAKFLPRVSARSRK